jgi:hypothetical protein
MFNVQTVYQTTRRRPIRLDPGHRQQLVSFPNKRERFGLSVPESLPTWPPVCINEGAPYGHNCNLVQFFAQHPLRILVTSTLEQTNKQTGNSTCFSRWVVVAPSLLPLPIGHNQSGIQDLCSLKMMYVAGRCWSRCCSSFGAIDLDPLSRGSKLALILMHALPKLLAVIRQGVRQPLKSMQKSTS